LEKIIIGPTYTAWPQKRKRGKWESQKHAGLGPKQAVFKEKAGRRTSELIEREKREVLKMKNGRNGLTDHIILLWGNKEPTKKQEW